MSLKTQAVYDFGPFRLDPAERTLLRDGQSVLLPPKAYDLLVTLVVQAGHLVTKDELLRDVWLGTFVEEANLSYTVSLLRRALGDDREPYRYIETVPKRGYRFKKPVATVDVPAGRNRSEAGVSDGAGSTGLRRLAPTVLAVGLLAAIVVVVLWLVSDRSNRPSHPEIRAIAILPLANLSGDREQEYFVEGMHDALITALTRLGSFQVVGRSSAMQYVGTDKTIATIAQELNVQAIVEGSVLRAGDEVRINVRVLDPAGHSIWAEEFDRSLRDVLKLHADVAQAIATEMVSATRGTVVPQVGARAVDPEAYEEYLKGRYHLNRRLEEDLFKAIDHFTRAIARFPDYAPAYAGLADCYNLAPLYARVAPSDAIPKAKAAAIRAITLDDGLAEGHASLAWASLTYDWDWVAADRQFQRAIALNPKFDTAHVWYGLMLVWGGKFQEGIREMEYARKLDPVSSVNLRSLLAALYLTRNYDGAIRESEAVVQLDDKWEFPWLGLAQLQKGLHQQAVQSLDRVLAVHPSLPVEIGRVAYGHGIAGDKKTALTLLTRLTTMARDRYVSAGDFAAVHLGLGENDKALSWLEKGLDERALEMMYLRTDPRFDPLRAEPRFQRLLERIGFPN